MNLCDIDKKSHNKSADKSSTNPEEFEKTYLDINHNSIEGSKDKANLINTIMEINQTNRGNVNKDNIIQINKSEYTKNSIKNKLNENTFTLENTKENTINLDIKQDEPIVSIFPSDEINHE